MIQIRRLESLIGRSCVKMRSIPSSSMYNVRKAGGNNLQNKSDNKDSRNNWDSQVIMKEKRENK